MKGPRCQSCRYQACLDAGMYHSGIQRTRGGRHGYSPVKQRSNSVEKYPTIQLPNISAVMSAAVQQVSSGIIGNNKKDPIEDQTSWEPADIVSVSMSPPSSDHTVSQMLTFVNKYQKQITFTYLWTIYGLGFQNRVLGYGSGL